MMELVRTLILGILILFCFSARSAVYNVATTGDDRTGDGSSGKPWRTIGMAASIVNPGDTVHIAAGVYNERVVLARSGTADNPITWVGVRNSTNWVTILDPSTTISTGWEPAPEMGNGVWRNATFDNVADLMTLDNKRISHLGDWQTSGSINFELAKTWMTSPTNVTVSHGGQQIYWWPSVEVVFWRESAGRGYTGPPPGPIYIRFKGLDNPNGKALRVSTNHGRADRRQGAAALRITASYNIVSNLWQRGTRTGIYLDASSDYNTITHSRFSHGTAPIYLNGASHNLIQSNYFAIDRYLLEQYAAQGAWAHGPIPEASYKSLLYTRHKMSGAPNILYHEDANTPRQIWLEGAGVGNRIIGNTMRGAHGGVMLRGGGEGRLLQDTHVAYNDIRHGAAAGIMMFPWHTGSQIYSNVFWDCKMTVRFQEWNTSTRFVTNFIYGNFFAQPIGVHYVWYWHNISTQVQTTHPAYYVYHNHFLGGKRSMQIMSAFPDMATLENTFFINNLFTGETVWTGSSSFKSGSRNVGAFDYNLVHSELLDGVSSSWAWWGMRNVITGRSLWSSDSIKFDVGPHSSLHHSVTEAVNSGLDLSQPFELAGKVHAPLPGMVDGYYAGNAPDIGAVQFGLLELGIPHPPTQLGAQ